MQTQTDCFFEQFDKGVVQSEFTLFSPVFLRQFLRSLHCLAVKWDLKASRHRASDKKG